MAESPDFAALSAGHLSLVHAQSEETLLSPVGAPAVPDDPVLLALSICTQFIINWVYLAVADHQNSVIDF